MRSSNGVVVAPSTVIRSQGSNLVHRSVASTSGGSVRLPVHYGGASTSTKPPEAAVRQTSTQGAASELGAPAQTQAASRAPVVRAAVRSPMGSPVPSVVAPSPGMRLRAATPTNRSPRTSLMNFPASKASAPGGQEPSRQASATELQVADQVSQMDRLVSTLKSYKEAVQKQLPLDAIVSNSANSRDNPKLDSIDASVSKSVIAMDATTAATATGAPRPTSFLATLAGVADPGFEARIEALFANFERSVEKRFAELEQRFNKPAGASIPTDIERRVEKRFAELEQRFSNQEGALIEVVAKMRQLVLDTDKRLKSLASESKEHVQQDPIIKRLSSLEVFPNADSKSLDSRIGTGPGTPDSTTRSLFGATSDISQSNVSQSKTSTDIHGQVRNLQMKVEVLQYEIKIDAGQVRRLHARIDLLETDINAINDREKRQVLTGGAGERQNDVEDASTSLAQSKTSSVPLNQIIERLTKVENEQKGLTDAMWQLREVVEAFDWKIEQYVSLVRTEDSPNKARIAFRS